MVDKRKTQNKNKVLTDEKQQKEHRNKKLNEDDKINIQLTNWLITGPKEEKIKIINSDS